MTTRVDGKVTCMIDADPYKLIKAIAALKGRKVGEAVGDAIYFYADEAEKHLAASKKSGTGGHRVAKAIRKMSIADKDAYAAANRKNLAAAGITDDD